MNILQIVQRFPPSLGGLQHHVHKISKELIKRGHDVTVVTTSSVTEDVRGFSTQKPFTLKCNYPGLPEFEIIDDIKVYRFKPLFKIWCYMFTPSMLKFLVNNIQNYDVVHAHSYMHAEPDMAALAVRLKNIPLILTAHDIVAAYGGFYKPVKWLYDRTIGKFTMSTAKYVIALTQENKKQYMALGVPEDKIKIIPNGVDYERFENVKPESVFDKIGNPDHIVLCVARIVKYKGIQHIIKAIPLIIKSFPDTKFVFIGEDQGYKKELVKIAENIGVLDYCEFINNVNNEDLADYYASADAFVLPSTGEGFGLVALESIVSGTPVILANCGGLKYILKDIGGYPLDITKDVSKQIAEQVEYIFSNQDKVKMEIERQKKIINEKYTWEGVGKMIEEVYYEVLSN